MISESIMDYRKQNRYKNKNKTKDSKTKCYGRSVIGWYIVYNFEMLLSLQSASKYERSVP